MQQRKLQVITSEYNMEYLLALVNQYDRQLVSFILYFKASSIEAVMEETKEVRPTIFGAGINSNS
jgi:hypothetical protein